jgi:hypothetical protein
MLHNGRNLSETVQTLYRNTGISHNRIAQHMDRHERLGHLTGLQNSVPGQLPSICLESRPKVADERAETLAKEVQDSQRLLLVHKENVEALSTDHSGRIQEKC